MHHEQMQYLPSGGWMNNYVGDPNGGFGYHQPGGWIFSILPFIEQQPLWNLGIGQGTAPFYNTSNATNDQRIQTPIATFNCPSRRPSQAYPGVCCAPTYADLTSTGAKTDYAVNLGDNMTYQCCYGYPSWPTLANWNTASIAWPTTPWTGISFMHSQVPMSLIRDGTTNTIMLGEKCIDPNHYLDGGDGGDDWSMYTGQQDDNTVEPRSLPNRTRRSTTRPSKIRPAIKTAIYSVARTPAFAIWRFATARFIRSAFRSISRSFSGYATGLMDNRSMRASIRDLLGRPDCDCWMLAFKSACFAGRNQNPTILTLYWSPRYSVRCLTTALLLRLLGPIRTQRRAKVAPPDR